jgi:hypothetical protein
MAPASASSTASSTDTTAHTAHVQPPDMTYFNVTALPVSVWNSSYVNAQTVRPFPASSFFPLPTYPSSTLQQLRQAPLTQMPFKTMYPEFYKAGESCFLLAMDDLEMDVLQLGAITQAIAAATTYEPLSVNAPFSTISDPSQFAQAGRIIICPGSQRNCAVLCLVAALQSAVATLGPHLVICFLRRATHYLIKNLKSAPSGTSFPPFLDPNSIEDIET